MDKIVEHNEKIYQIDTTLEDRHFATVYELLPRKASGIIADFLREYSGQEQYAYDRVILDDDALVRIVLELGRKFSHSCQWQRLWEWAEMRSRK